MGGLGQLQPVLEGLRQLQPVLEGPGQPQPVLEGLGQLQPVLEGLRQLQPVLEGPGQPQLVLEGLGQLQPVLEGLGQLQPVLEGPGQLQPVLEGLGQPQPERNNLPKKTLYYLYIIIFSASKIFFQLLLSLVRWISLVFSFGLISTSLSTSFSDNSFVLTKSWQSCSSHALYFCKDFIPSRQNFRKANLLFFS